MDNLQMWVWVGVGVPPYNVKLPCAFYLLYQMKNFPTKTN